MLKRYRLRATVYAPLFTHLCLRKCVFEPVLMKPVLLNLLLPKRVRILVTIPDDSVHERMSRATRKAHVVERHCVTGGAALWEALRCRKYCVVESAALQKAPYCRELSVKLRDGHCTLLRCGCELLALVICEPLINEVEISAGGC